MADDLPRATVAYRMPRRLRMRVPSRKGDRAYSEHAAERSGNRGASPATGHATEPPGSGTPPRFPFPPAVLRMMARYWNCRLAELDGSIAAETGPERRAAFERLCVQGLLAGLDHRLGAS